MYDLLDRPTFDLPAFERDTLDATRRWVHALTLAGRAAAGPATPTPFDRVMETLDRGSSDTLVIERPCHPTVEETEAVILGLWRLARAGRPNAAREAAASLVGPAHAGALVAAMADASAR